MKKENFERDMRAMRFLYLLFGFILATWALQFLFKAECPISSYGGMYAICHYVGPQITGVLICLVCAFCLWAGSKKQLRKTFEKHYT